MVARLFGHRALCIWSMTHTQHTSSPLHSRIIHNPQSAKNSARACNDRKTLSSLFCLTRVHTIKSMRATIYTIAFWHQGDSLTQQPAQRRSGVFLCTLPSRWDFSMNWMLRSRGFHSINMKESSYRRVYVLMRSKLSCIIIVYASAWCDWKILIWLRVCIFEASLPHYFKHARYINDSNRKGSACLACGLSRMVTHACVCNHFLSDVV